MTIHDIEKEFDKKKDQLVNFGTTGINTGGFMTGDMGANNFWLEPNFIKTFISSSIQKLLEEIEGEIKEVLPKEGEFLTKYGEGVTEFGEHVLLILKSKYK